MSRKPAQQQGDDSKNLTHLNQAVSLLTWDCHDTELNEPDVVVSAKGDFGNIANRTCLLSMRPANTH
jgi:phosphoketolase